MDADGRPVETAAAAGGDPAAAAGGEPDAGIVSQSLEGLVDAVDELKRSMGLGEQVDFAAVEEYIQKLRQENEEFRQFAEEAIRSAQRLRDERDELQARLDQAGLEQTMGAALAEAQKLKDVADEFERDLYQQKLAEAAARVAEVETLRERIAELEDENAGLTQTLNEFRQTTQQLQKLQSAEVRRLQAAERAGGSRSTPPASTTSAAGTEAGSQASAGASAASSPHASSLDGAAAGPSFRPTRSPSRSPKSAAAAALAAEPLQLQPTAQGAEAVRIAEQLEEVAGGSDSGLLASAALSLRELSKRDAQLLQLQQENRQLKAEVDELNDTMFSKTFKPPSAWAEREIKYKTDKKYWEEQQKELQAQLASLTKQIEAYRGAGKAHELEARIQELEASLLQSEREKDNVKAQLHELQLSTRTEGEFEAGKKISPYMSPVAGALGAEGHEVQIMVEQMEHRTGSVSPRVLSATPRRTGTSVLEAQLQAAVAENQQLKQQLQAQQLVSIPASLQAELGQVAPAAAVAATVATLEAQLQQVEAESAALRQQQEGGGSAEASVQAQELQAQAQQAEAAGDAEGAERLRQQAQHLQQLEQQWRQAEAEQHALRQQLEQLSAAAAAAAPEEGADAAAEVAVPEALQAELGTSAPMGVVQTKVAELEQRLKEAEAEAANAAQQLKQSVALGQAVQQAATQQQAAEAALTSREQQADANEPESEQAEAVGEEQLRQQLAAAQQQKEAAQQQLWQLTELQEQLQQAEAERRKLQAQLQQAQQPVRLQLAVDGGEAAAEQQQDPAELEQLRAELAGAQQRSDELRTQLAALAAAEQPVTLSLQLGAETDGSGVAERLQKAEAEAARLRQQLVDLQPVRMQLTLQGDATAASSTAVSVSDFGSRPSSAPAGASRRITLGSPGGPLPLVREGSDISLAGYNTEQASALSAERAATEAALAEHHKSTSDVPSLLRAKAELETRCQMLEAQLAKMQGELEHADEMNAVCEDQLDSALKTGDVSGLNGLKEKLANGRHSLSKRMFKRQGGKAGASPTKDVLRNTVHEMQDALTSSEEEKNALKRQLAKLSKKYQQVTQQQAHTAGIIAGAQAMQPVVPDSPEPTPRQENGQGADDELELLKMREENQMLMEHVVMVKVRQAEMEGEYLEAKRQLLRTREKNLQLAKKLADLRDAAERGDPLPFTPKHGSTAAGAGAEVSLAAGAPGSEKPAKGPLGARLPAV